MNENSANTSSWGLIEKNGLFLFIQRSNVTSRPGQWCPPGGGRELHESPEEACIREVKEEVDLDVSIEKLILVNESFHYFLCKPIEQENCKTLPKINLKLNECQSYQWIALRDIISLGYIMELKKMLKVLSKLGCDIDLQKG